MGEIANQDEVTRRRQKCFARHGCMGFWQPEYATMGLAALISSLLAKRDPGRFSKVTTALRRLM